MRRAYLALSIIGFIAPYVVFGPWVARNGLDWGLFVERILSTPLATFLVVDVAISALAIVLLAAQGLRQGDMRMVWPILGTLTVGVSLSLPLYLYLTGDAGVKRPVTARG